MLKMKGILEMKKRLVSAVLLITLLLAVAVGCKQSPSADTGSPGQSASSPGQSANSPGQSATGDGSSVPATGAPPNANEKDYSEHVVISLASVQVNESVDYNNGDEFTKWWTSKFNFSWDITGLGWDVWSERLRVWIYAGDMPDVVTWDYNHGEAIKYIEEGLVYRFPDDWKERWPNVAKAYADTMLGPALEEMVGGTYVLPKPVYSTLKPTEKIVPHTTAYIRKDWAQAVGFEIKDYYTVSEIMEFARLLVEHDPGHVGSALVPLALRPDLAWIFFVNSNSTHAGGGFYKGDDGRYQWGPASQDTLAGLKLYQQAFREGLLSPEFYAYSGEQDNYQFYITGVAGVTMFQGMAGAMQVTADYFKNNLNLEYDDAVHTCAIIGEDGKYHSPEQINFWTAYLFSPKITQAKFERYMDMLDFASSPEANVFIRMGFEGIDWEYDENGELVSLLGDQLVPQKYPSVYPCYDAMYILANEFQLINPAYRKEFREREIFLYETKYSLGDEKTLPAIDWDVQLYSSPAKNRLSYNWATQYAEFVLADGDIETAWRNWINSQSYLIDPVLEEFNMNFAG